MVTTPVEIECNAMQCNAMVLALEIEFFAMVYVKTTCKNIFSSSNYDKGFVIKKRPTYKN